MLLRHPTNRETFLDLDFSFGFHLNPTCQWWNTYTEGAP